VGFWELAVMPENPFDDYIDLDQAARDLEVHQQTVRRQIKGGNLPATKIGGKYWIQLDKYRQFKANYDSRPGRKRVPRLI